MSNERLPPSCSICKHCFEETDEVEGMTGGMVTIRIYTQFIRTCGAGNTTNINARCNQKKGGGYKFKSKLVGSIQIPEAIEDRYEQFDRT